MLALALLACTADDPYPFEPYVGVDGPPDAATDRLCVEAADPEGAEDKVFIDCRTEGADLRREDAPAKDAVKVVAWNLERGFHLDEQLEVLRNLDADVLLISEADRGCARTDGRNVPWEVADELGLAYVFAVEFVELPRPDPMGIADDSCEHGNFVASRYPLGNVAAFRHQQNRSWYEEGERRLGGRIAVEADVQVGERYLHVTVVHFESEVTELEVQVAQAEETAVRAMLPGIPTLVGGDTNAPFYGLDLYNGTANDKTTQAFLTRGYADAHIGLDPAERATIAEGFVIDLLFSDAPTRDPGLCDEHGCGGLTDHKAVWATVALDADE